MIIATAAHSDPGDGWREHMWGYGGGMFWGPVAWLFWIAVIVAVVVVIGRLTRRDQSGNRDDEALRILKERYARGEIDKSQYESMRRDLDR